MTNRAARPSSDVSIASTRSGSTRPVRSMSTHSSSYRGTGIPMGNRRPAGARIRTPEDGLESLRVQLDDELFLDGHRHVLSRGATGHPAHAILLVQRQPLHERRTGA